MVVASIVTLAFIALAVWHFRMALSPSRGTYGVPSVDGKPLFVPSARATMAVGIVLLAFALLVAATGGLVSIGLAPRLLSWISLALAAGLLARAVGDFRYVGFFKRVRASRFAQLDTRVFSPLCLALAIGVATIAWRNGV
jgi:hypothetical protein